MGQREGAGVWAGKAVRLCVLVKQEVTQVSL